MYKFFSASLSGIAGPQNSKPPEWGAGTVIGYVAVGPDQIGLVAVDNRTMANHRFKFRAIGAFSSGLRSSFAARTVGDWNQLPAVVV